MPTLIERLEGLGIKRGSQIKKVELKEISRDLGETLNASPICNQFGNVLKVENFYAFGYEHGNVKFVPIVQTGVINEVGKVTTESENQKNLIFLDTETTGLSGGTGTMAFLIGIAIFEDLGVRLIQLFIEDPIDEPAMLLELSNLLDQKNSIVSFNGKSFDVPLLKNRFIINRLPIIFSEFGHLDILHVSRKIWRNRLESRTLKDLEFEILQVIRSEDEVPGWMIPEVYFNYLRTGNVEQIKGIVYHNRIDILSLVALYLKISTLLEDEAITDELHVLEAFSLGKIYQEIGSLDRSNLLFKYCLKNLEIEKNLTVEIRSRLASNYKKEKIWESAVECWIENSLSGDIHSCVELAKYHEHVQSDCQQALLWTNKAIEYLDKIPINRFTKKSFASEFEIRKNRLKKRIKHV